MTDKFEPWEYPEQDSYGHCACICCCSRGADGPDQKCSECRVDLHARDISGTLAELRLVAQHYINERFQAINQGTPEAGEHVRARERFWREHRGRTE